MLSTYFLHLKWLQVGFLSLKIKNIIAGLHIRFNSRELFLLNEFHYKLATFYSVLKTVIKTKQCLLSVCLWSVLFCFVLIDNIKICFWTSIGECTSSSNKMIAIYFIFYLQEIKFCSQLFLNQTSWNE
jgi:hypothetical protein